MDGGWVELHPWRIARGAEAGPVFRQIYGEIRTAIATRALAPGARLPSTRELAQRLGISRTSVVTAYEQLAAEGWIDCRTGSGAYVGVELPAPFRAEAAPPAAPARFATDPEALFEPLRASGDPGHRPFDMGLALMDARSQDVWRRITHRSVRRMDEVHFGYTDPRGLPGLRQGLAAYLAGARGLKCEPGQVLVVSGTQHAMDLTARLLLRPGDEVWVEDPGYPMTCKALAALGLRIVPVPVDEQGLVAAEGVRRAPGARAAVVTPSHQYPTGAVLSMARRAELLAWARTSGAWIIEDDYDSELRFRGRPLAALQGLDESGRVIYVGTLNKSLFPGLRIGCLVAPPSLLEGFLNARHLSDRQPPTLTQTVLSDFIAEGHLAAHFRRLRQLYRRAQDVVTGALAPAIEAVGGRLPAPDQGNHLVAWLPEGFDDVALERAARAEGVTCRALSRLYLQAPPRPGLMLGFTGFRPEQLQAPSERLAALIAAG
ncbi:MAG TPA: PLP-dependent aminotransferase family protein [Caulobacteraceae bacterium]|nr:PLP-dependent aminotransferase family protein [Caulobacteraceae bacterium]